MPFRRFLPWFLVLILIPLAPVRVRAQKHLTIEEAVLRRGGELSPSTLRGFQFRPGTKHYSHIVGDALHIRELKTGKLVQQVSAEQLWRMLNVDGSSRTYFPSYRWHDKRTITFWEGRTRRYVDLTGMTAWSGHELPAGADNYHPSPGNGPAFAYNQGQAVYYCDGRGGHHVVTADTAEGIVNGRAVHRDEFGIDRGIFFSPQGKRLAFYRMDEHMVREYPLVTVSPRQAEARPIRYPMAGMTSHHVTLGVYTPGQQGVVWVQTPGPDDHYLTNVTWSPDENFIYIAEINRGQDTLQMNRYDARTGEFDRTLFTEVNARYVDPQHPIRFVPEHPDRFVWESQRAGHNHLYLYSAQGELLRPLTQGDWEVIDLLDFSPNGRYLYCVTNRYNVLGRDLMRVDLESGETERLTNQDGTNRIVLDVEGGRFASFWTAFSNPGGVYWGDLKKGAVATLHTARNPLENFDMPKKELVRLLAADGKTTLYGRLFTPPTLEPGLKYPVVMYVYGGPHAQMVTDSWYGGASYWEPYMAQQGYVVFCMDNRGSANRGFEFEQGIHRQLGELEMLDQMEGVKYLKSLPYVDTARLGVHGWSYGGFMTLSLLLRQGNTFKVGVAGGPVTDWKYYEVMYGERYMDRPEENEAGYATARLHGYVKNLEGKRLLLLQGYQDPVVVPQHMLTFMRTCNDAGMTQLDALFYPGHPHNVRGADRVQLMAKITDYFNVFLKNR